MRKNTNVENRHRGIRCMRTGKMRPTEIVLAEVKIYENEKSVALFRVKDGEWHAFSRSRSSIWTNSRVYDIELVCTHIRYPHKHTLRSSLPSTQATKDDKVPVE